MKRLSTKKPQRLIAYEQEQRFSSVINGLFSTASITYIVHEPKKQTDIDIDKVNDDNHKEVVDKKEDTQKAISATNKPQQNNSVRNFYGHSVSDYFKSIVWVKSIICSIKQQGAKSPSNQFEKRLKKIILTSEHTLFFDSLSALLKDYQLHPYFELIHQQCQKITTEYSSQNVMDVIPELTKTIKQVSSELAFKQKLNQFTIRSTKNYAQLIRYCRQLNDLYPTLNVIKLTINVQGYLEESKMDSREFILSPYRAPNSLEYKLLKERYQRFIKHLKKLLSDDVFVGYAGSISFLPCKSYTLQVLLFFKNSLEAQIKYSELKTIKQSINSAWLFKNDHNGPIYQIKQHEFNSEENDFWFNLASSIIQLTQLNRYLKYKNTHDKTFGHGRISAKKIAYVNQQIENTKQFLTTGSPLMANPPHQSKLTNTLRYQKRALASLFINQNAPSISYGPLKTIDELEDLKQKQLINTVETLINLIELTNVLIKDHMPHYQWVELSNGEKSIYASEHGKTLYYFLCQDLKPIQSVLSELSFNPLLTLFFATLNPWQKINSINTQVPKDPALYLAVESFITQLRSHATNDNAKYSTLALVNTHQKAVDKNYRSLVNYIKVLEKKHSALLVFQVEFAYYKTLGLIKSSPVGMSFISQNNQNYSLVKQHRQALFKQLNKTYGERLAGFAWKLKYSSTKGFYHEWLLLFDERNKPATSESIKLRSLWLYITQNKGSVHFQGCRLNKTKDYRSSTPKEQRAEQKERLNAMLCSLTQIDQYVYFDPKTLNSQTTDRTFNRGHL